MCPIKLAKSKSTRFKLYHTPSFIYNTKQYKWNCYKGDEQMDTGKRNQKSEPQPILQLPDHEELRRRLHEVSTAVLNVDRLYPIILRSAGNKVGPDDLALMVITAVQSVFLDENIVLSNIASFRLTYGPFLEKIVIALVKDLQKEAFFRSAFHRQASKHSKLIHF